MRWIRVRRRQHAWHNCLRVEGWHRDQGGELTLEIPPGALTEDTQISVGKIPEEEWSEAIKEGDPPLAVYQLEPDGLQLLEPATLTVQLLVEHSLGQLFVIHVFGDDLESVTVDESKFDPETNTLTVSIQLTHFSIVEIWWGRREVFGARIVRPSSRKLRVPVGEPFLVTVTVTRNVEPG